MYVMQMVNALISAMTILVGCSGGSYDDWVGRFYPTDLAKKKGE